MALRFLSPLIFILVLQQCSAVSDEQKPLVPQSAVTGIEKALQNPAKDGNLHGRFLHITDFHPDPFYKLHSSTDDSCHRGKGEAGTFGAEKSDCDSPFSLINATFQWINDNLKDTIDFVVWTGDSARHDNDEDIPRTETEIVQLNELLVDKFVQVFGKDKNINASNPTDDFIIPIVPNLGNNDIMPHNILVKGPNRWTKRFSHIWRKFIPEEQQHSFVRGGWFMVEVIPDRLAVFSLNTLYFFDNNAAVDGCAKKTEAGYEQMEWLRVQLQLLRERGMKAILMGHVPPARTESKQSWDETCWQKYTLWLQQYRDVVSAALYGHMNIDHFMLQDNMKVDIKIASGELKPHQKIKKQSSAEYLTELRMGWSELPNDVPKILDDDNDLGAQKHKKKDKLYKKIGGKWGERYSVSLVTASVVPNYFPTMRLFEYNITGLDSSISFATSALKTSNPKEEKHHKKKYKFKLPFPPSKSSPPGPAYSQQPLTLLGYTQYYANLTHLNSLSSSNRAPKLEYEIEYSTFNDPIFSLKDLTVRSYLKLAGQIGKFKTLKGTEKNLGSECSGQSGETERSEPEDPSDSSQKDMDSSENDEEEFMFRNTRKGGGKHKKQKRINKIWYTFIQRAYVGAKGKKELREHF
ncbi:MAG: hypothetical protein LQ351_006369 [Letrouitia transgressa]|nr:MAG: hypothetical protein LQ351_006369 [Letrouitia transgressa]